MKLIALITVAVLIDGVRTTFAAGEQVTGLSSHDITALKACGAVVCEEEQVAEQRKADKQAKAIGKEFADARQAVQAHQASADGTALVNK
ncbi:MAG: hypothetical protein ACKVOO_12440 [Burkholderiaceae bacterium]